jgi:hypothetical protein
MIIYGSDSQPFLGGDTHFENEKLETHLEYPNKCLIAYTKIKSYGLELFDDTLTEARDA